VLNIIISLIIGFTIILFDIVFFLRDLILLYLLESRDITLNQGILSCIFAYIYGHRETNLSSNSA